LKDRAVDDGTAPGSYSVRHAIADYVEHLEDRPDTQQKTKDRLGAYVPESLAKIPLIKLTAADIGGWLKGMAKQPAKSHGASRRADMRDDETIRKRQSSANRVFTQLRAALNLAFKAGKTPSDAAWRRITPFKGVDVARIRYLSVAESQRLLNACEPDFRPLVRAGLETGCRYAELCRLRVEDFNKDSGTVHIRKTKAWKARHVILTDDGQAFFASLVAGRKGPMFADRWVNDKRSMEQRKPIADACDRAGIEPLGFNQLRHTWASLSVMAGVPLIVVAKNLGHSDTRMVEKHYGHLAPSYIADAIRAHAPRFGTVETNVKAIR
jgi:integrase